MSPVTQLATRRLVRFISAWNSTDVRLRPKRRGAAGWERRGNWAGPRLGQTSPSDAGDLYLNGEMFVDRELVA